MTNESGLTRRHFLAGAASAAAIAGVTGLWPLRSSARVVVIGGGPGGVALALGVKSRAPHVEILLIERDPTRLAPSRGDWLVRGALQGGDFSALHTAGIGVAIDEIRAVDWRARRAHGFSGREFAFDSIVFAPGIASRDEGIAGYDALAAHEFPHALTDSRGARRLAAQIEAMPEGGVMVIRAPSGPQRYPQGPYERATAIASYFRDRKPHAKILILDDKDSMPGQERLLDHWAREFPGMIEWVARSAGGQVVAVDARTHMLETSAGRVHADVINFIPAQRAGEIAETAGLTDRSGWCPVHGMTMRSRTQEAAFVIGDAVAGSDHKLAGTAVVDANSCAAALLGAGQVASAG